MSKRSHCIFLSLRGIMASLVLMLLISSCSSTRRLIKEPLREEGAAFLFENLKQNELKYDYLSARFSAEFSQDRNRNSFSGNIRIKKDSIIWISIVPALGIEMIRVMITNDSVWFINRIENTYMIGDFSYINSLINSSLDFDMLQAFLTGNDFSFYENSEFRASVDHQEYKLMTTNRRKLKKESRNNQETAIPVHDIWLDPESFKISRVMIRELNQGGRRLEGRYRYTKLENQMVPSRLQFELEANGHKNTIQVDFTRISINEKLQFPFRIPEKYTPLGKL